MAFPTSGLLGAIHGKYLAFPSERIAGSDKFSELSRSSAQRPIKRIGEGKESEVQYRR
jgi:hypothetical protein